ncbi:MAG: ABC transporter ATP-binding protein [Planctomycetales bacterium]|nr:ABC transporter ATP-binding protein [Planctomycetales bacterium]
MIVQTDSLTKRYGEFVALHECTLGVDRGEVFGLLGPNGAGKTTLIRTLMGFLRPTSGTATIDGLDCTKQSVAVHAKVAYLPGDARLFRRMRGSEVLRFFADARRDGDFQKAKDLAKRLDLDTKRRVGLMSTGMRQKLALAATLATEATILILDEPTSNLDPNVRREIGRMLAEAKSNGRTILLSSHVLSEIEESCDRVVILRRGQLVHTQVMSDLRVRHQFTATSSGPLPTIPESLRDRISIVETTKADTRSRVTLHTTGDLAQCFEWLASVSLSDVRVEPLGLRYIYDQYHHTESAS